MFEEILQLASAIVRPTEAEQPLLEALCTAAEAELAGQLREGITAEDCREIFPCAAALLAAAGLLPCRDSGEAVRFTAGDISLQPSGSCCQTAAAMRHQAAAMMAPYWEDNTFAFREVRG